MTSPNQRTPRCQFSFCETTISHRNECSQLVMLPLERSEKPHVNASPTVSFPLVLEEKRHINSWCCFARRTMALACRQCRTGGSLRACCDKLTCTARSGLLSLANHWTAPLHSRRLLISGGVALSSGWARARTVTLLIFKA